MSIVLLSSTVKVRGCSAKVLSVSSSNLAGTATLPWLSESISITADIVVSKSEAVTVSSLLSSSNKKLSRIGRVLLLRSEEHTSELQSRPHLVCRLLLEKKKKD